MDLKPSSALVIPKTIKDFERLLDNTSIMNATPGLSQLSADEYYLPSFTAWRAIDDAISRNAYIWQAEIYESQVRITDWDLPYSQVFYANSVLDALSSNQEDNEESEKNRIKGWAHFCRAYAFYSLLSVYSKAYDEGSAQTDLGIPLKLSSDISRVEPRSSLKDSYRQVIADALAASELLQDDIVLDKRNRPSKTAAFAFLSRVYLSMRQYAEAEKYADYALARHSVLIDYNALPIGNGSSFDYNSPETIYFSQQSPIYGQLTYPSGGTVDMDSTLMILYDESDLRRQIYFFKESNGSYSPKKGINSPIAYPFTGIATDEVMLIKAECLARRNEKQAAINLLNELVKSRTKTGNFKELQANTSDLALDLVLQERRKALVWRSLRWTDLKRLNKEGRNIVLSRKLSEQIYILEPNSPKYALPIPQSEIILSGLTQNIR